MNGVNVKHPNIRYVQGRTIAEVIIAMAIGLIILLAVTSLFVTNSQTYKVSDDKSLLEEEARLALNLMAYHIRMGGYQDVSSGSGSKHGALGGSGDDASGIQAFMGCSGDFASPTNLLMACNGSGTSDSMAIRYVIDTAMVTSASAGGASGPTDCIGQPSLAVTTPIIVENRFYVATNPVSNVKELYCVGNGGVAPGANFNPGKPLAANIVQMKVTYGYDQDADQSVDGFYSAASIPTLPVPPPFPNEQPDNPWLHVLSAKICIVARSKNDGVARQAQVYKDCDGSTVTATDKRFYSSFTTVVALRGRTTGRSL